MCLFSHMRRETGFTCVSFPAQLLDSKRSPLVALTQLKKICDHPRLLTNKQCHALNLGVDKGCARTSRGHSPAT